jgi:hypothetical protein
MLYRLPVVLFALATAACTISLDGDGVLVREERRFPVTGGAVELTLTTFDGAIDVRSWDRSEILVEVEKRAASEEAANSLQVRASQQGNRISIDVPVSGRDDIFGFSQSVSLRVMVPASVTLRAHTGDGSISVERLDGSLELRSGDGGIRLDRVSGQVRATTGDGSIYGIDVTGRADLSSGDGQINVSGQFRALRVDTGDGSVNIEADPGSEMDEDWVFTTGDGGITLRLPADFAAEVDAESGDGNISVDGDRMSGQARADASPSRDDIARLRTRLGAGGRTIRLRSGDGSIRLVSR